MGWRQVRRWAVLWLAAVCCLWMGVAPADAADGERILKKGMQGEDVRQLQQHLFDLGYPLKVDGIFGQETETVVRQFQEDEQLTVDGVVGPKTRAALAAALERLAGALQEGAVPQAPLVDGAAGDAEGDEARHGKLPSRGGERDAAAENPGLTTDGPAQTRDAALEDVLDKLYAFAEAYFGVPYRYGGTGLDGIDCSALTQLAMRALGYDIPRSSVEHATVGRPVERHELRAGDLVFFNTSGSGISHVAIYLEDNWLLNASVSKGVTYTSLLENYWDKRYHSAQRIIEP